MADVEVTLPTAVEDLIDAIDFQRAGADQSLGRDALGAIAQALIDRTVADQKRPDGGALKPLAESTLARKRQKGQPELITVATGETLSLREVLGSVSIGPDEATMSHGTNQHARDKARWLTEQGRDFYALSPESEAAAMDVIEEYLDRLLESI